MKPPIVASLLALLFFSLSHSTVQGDPPSALRPTVTKRPMRPLPVDALPWSEMKKRMRVSSSPLANDSLWSFGGHDEITPSYAYFQKLEGETRVEYLKRSTDKGPVVFYRHWRSISFTLGHKGRLVLINDSPASKCNEVVISDIGKGAERKIGQRAVDDYFGSLFAKGVPERDRLEVERWTLPIGIGFSPNDTMILIHMENNGFQRGGLEEKRLAALYQDRYYVVDAENGKVLKTYRAKDIPSVWWK